MIVLDACMLIAHLTNDDAHHNRATRLLVSLAGQRKTMSVLTRAEVLVIPARVGRRHAGRAAGGTAGTHRPTDARLLRTAHC